MTLGRKKVVAPGIGENLEVRELMLKDALPLIPLVEREDKTEFVIRLLAASLYVDGKPIGFERISEIGVSALQDVMKIVPIAIELNGFEEKTTKKA